MQYTCINWQCIFCAKSLELFVVIFVTQHTAYPFVSSGIFGFVLCLFAIHERYGLDNNLICPLSANYKADTPEPPLHIGHRTSYVYANAGITAYASYIGWGEGWYCESALDTITKGKYLYSPVLWQTGIYVSEHTDQKPWRACMNDKIQRRSDCDELHDVTPATVSVYKCEERK